MKKWVYVNLFFLCLVSSVYCMENMADDEQCKLTKQVLSDLCGDVYSINQVLDALDKKLLEKLQDSYFFLGGTGIEANFYDFVTEFQNKLKERTYPFKNKEVRDLQKKVRDLRRLYNTLRDQCDNIKINPQNKDSMEDEEEEKFFEVREKLDKQRKMLNDAFNKLHEAYEGTIRKKGVIDTLRGWVSQYL